jgi:hypothetical protein
MFVYVAKIVGFLAQPLLADTYYLTGCTGALLPGP